MIPATSRLYLDGVNGVGGNTYITEGAGDVIRFFAGGAAGLNISSTEVVVNEVGGNSLDFRAETDNSTVGLFVDASADNVFIGDNANTNASGLSLTINQGGADDTILAFKSSDVAHGITAVQETDTYGYFQKVSANDGGLYLTGLRDANADAALVMRGIVSSDPNTDPPTTATGNVVEIDGALKSGTGVTALAAESNVFAVTNNATNEFVVKGDGELYSNQSATVGTFDSYDDAALVRAYDRATSPATVIDSEWDEYVRYNEQDLIDAGILTAPVGQGAMVSVTKLQRLHNGAIWQLSTKLRDMTRRLDSAESKLAALDA